MISTRLIRCSWIASDEENVNKLLYDARLRDFCDGELNYTGCETSRSETDHWTGTTEGTWNVLRTLREVDAISAMANSTTQNDSQCESFFYLYSLIRCSRITSDEENVNKLLCDVRLRVRIFWEANFTVRSFEPAMGKSTKLLQFYLSQIFYHYNVYIIMIFFVFILKHHDINVSKSFFL